MRRADTSSSQNPAPTKRPRAEVLPAVLNADGINAGAIIVTDQSGIDHSEDGEDFTEIRSRKAVAEEKRKQRELELQQALRAKEKADKRDQQRRDRLERRGDSGASGQAARSAKVTASTSASQGFVRMIPDQPELELPPPTAWKSSVITPPPQPVVSLTQIQMEELMSAQAPARAPVAEEASAATLSKRAARKQAKAAAAGASGAPSPPGPANGKKAHQQEKKNSAKGQRKENDVAADDPAGASEAVASSGPAPGKGKQQGKQPQQQPQQQAAQQQQHAQQQQQQQGSDRADKPKSARAEKAEQRKQEKRKQQKLAQQLKNHPNSHAASGAGAQSAHGPTLLPASRPPTAPVQREAAPAAPSFAILPSAVNTHVQLVSAFQPNLAAQPSPSAISVVPTPGATMGGVPISAVPSLPMNTVNSAAALAFAKHSQPSAPSTSHPAASADLTNWSYNPAFADPFRPASSANSGFSVGGMNMGFGSNLFAAGPFSQPDWKIGSNAQTGWQAPGAAVGSAMGQPWMPPAAAPVPPMYQRRVDGHSTSAPQASNIPVAPGSSVLNAAAVSAPSDGAQSSSAGSGCGKGGRTRGGQKRGGGKGRGQGGRGSAQNAGK
jgi:hypothetical protein